MRNSRFHDVREQLLNAGVSPRRVRRMISELAHHFDDLRNEMKANGASPQQAEAEASARLQTSALVEGVLARPELRSWVRRWPWLAFTVLPLTIYAALSVATIAVLILSVEFAKSAMGTDFTSSAGLQLIARAVLGGIEWILPILAAAACCAIALSRRAPAFWAVVGVVLISSIGALTNAQLQLPPIVPQPAFNAGIGFSTESLLLPTYRAALTLSVVLVLYFWRLSRQNRGGNSQSS